MDSEKNVWWADEQTVRPKFTGLCQHCWGSKGYILRQFSKQKKMLYFSTSDHVVNAKKSEKLTIGLAVIASWKSRQFDWPRVYTPKCLKIEFSQGNEWKVYRNESLFYFLTFYTLYSFTSREWMESEESVNYLTTFILLYYEFPQENEYKV